MKSLLFASLLLTLPSEKHLEVSDGTKTRAVLRCSGEPKMQASDRDGLSIVLTCESGSITLYDADGRVLHKIEARRY